MSDDIIICCAPAPGELQCEKHPGELDQAEACIRAYNAGAAIGHMHARDERLLQTVDVTLFRSQVQRIRRETPLIIEGSTGGAPEHTREQRCVTFTVEQVELGSLNLGSVNMYDAVFLNRYDDIVFYARKLRKSGVLPIMPVFDLSHLANFRRLAEAGHIGPPYIFELVFDVPNALPYSDEYLRLLVSHLPPGAQWFCVRYHQKGVRDLWTVMDLGGHVRVGYEDSPFLSDGRRARDNAELVEDAVTWCEKAGRKVVGPERARQLLGLPTVK
jgi:3-keto-5-aminohexanoate cleavage enzyme